MCILLIDSLPSMQTHGPYPPPRRVCVHQPDPVPHSSPMHRYNAQMSSCPFLSPPHGRNQWQLSFSPGPTPAGRHSLYEEGDYSHHCWLLENLICKMDRIEDLGMISSFT